MSIVHATRGVYGPTGGSPVAMATGGSYVASWSGGAAPIPAPPEYSVQSHMYEHQLVASDNDLPVPKGFPEPMQFLDVNNCMREYMSRKARLLLDAGGAGVAQADLELNATTGGYDLVVQAEQAFTEPPDGCEIAFRLGETNPNPLWLALRAASYLDNGKYGIFDTAPNEYIDYGQTDDLAGASQATWSGWVRLSSNFGAGYSGSILFFIYGGGGWEFGMTNGYRARLRIASGSTPFVWSNNAVFTPGSWHHFAAVFDAGVASLYIDGSPVASTTYGTLPSTIQPAVPSFPTNVLRAGDNFGQHSNSADLRHVAYWAGTAASAAQVAELYNSAQAPNLSSLPTMPAPTFWAPMTGSWSLLAGSQTATPVGSPTFGSGSAVSALALAGTAYPLQDPQGGALRGGALRPDAVYRAVFNEQLGQWRLLADLTGTRVEPIVYPIIDPNNGQVALEAKHVSGIVVCESTVKQPVLTVQIPDTLEQRWPIGESIELVNRGHTVSLAILPPPNGNLILRDWPPSNAIALLSNEYHDLKLTRVDALNVMIMGLPGAVY